MLAASVSGDVERLQTLIASGAPLEQIDETSEHRDTALRAAARHGQLRSLEELLKAGAAVDAVSDRGLSALWFACRNGHETVVQVLLAARATVEKGDNDGWTPLFTACQNGHNQVVRVLLSAKADANRMAANGVTSLVLAVQARHRECVALLLEMGGAAPDQAAERDGCTALFNAAERGDVDCATLLLNAHAAVDAPSKIGCTPLFIASQEGHAPCVQLLLAAGAEVNRAKVSGATPLYMSSQMGRLEVARLLLDANADVDLGLTGPAKYPTSLLVTRHEINPSPMLVACHHGQLELVKLLSSYGATRQPAMSMVMGEKAPPIRAFLERSQHWMPLHHVEVNPPSRTRALLRDGADPTTPRYVRWEDAYAAARSLPGAGLSGGGHESPLDVATALLEKAGGGASTTGASTDAIASAWMVVDAARPWSVATHALWPDAERRSAAALLRVGLLIARSYREHEGVLQQLWRDRVMPFAITRCGGVSGGIAAVSGEGSSQPLEGSQSAPLPSANPPLSFAPEVAASSSANPAPPVAKTISITKHPLADGKIVAHYLY